MKRMGLILFVMLVGINLFSQISPNNTLTPDQIVQNILSGPGVTISNVTFNGGPGNVVNDQIGTFNNGNNSVGMDSGLVLCTGNIGQIVGPNNSGSFSSAPAIDGGADPDLNTLCSNTTFNKAVLEFDFVPLGDTVKFNYVFCSEEYNEYVCSGFNDVFGFFISGPGYSGPFTLSSENIALIPGTNTPVAINTINNGVAGTFGSAATCEAANPNWDGGDSQYYVNNDLPSDPGYNNIQYDGFTVKLTAVAPVQCGQTYHIKIAIGDAGDPIYDSGVMLEAGSFSSELLQITGGSFSNGSVSSDTLFIEGCESAIFIFKRLECDTADADTFDIVISGTATNGVDYNGVPNQLIIPSGVVQDTIFLNALFDGIPEPDESVTLTIYFTNLLGDPDTATFTLYISDYAAMNVVMGGDTTLCPGFGSPPVLEPLITGGYGNYSYLWYPTADTTDTLIAFMGETTVFYVNIEDDCGNVIQSPPVTIVVQCPIIIPNVITANNDGTNDLFKIQNIEQYPENEVWFYNRWGTLLHYEFGYQNSWKPELSDGVYYYVVDDKVDDPFKGFFTVFN